MNKIYKLKEGCTPLEWRMEIDISRHTEWL